MSFDLPISSPIDQRNISEYHINSEQLPLPTEAHQQNSSNATNQKDYTNRYQPIQPPTTFVSAVAGFVLIVAI